MKKNVKYGAGAGLFTILTLAAVVAVNLISAKSHKRFDLSAERVFSLSQQTVKTLKSLTEDVTVYAFIREEKTKEARDLLEQYAYESPKFRFEILDPDKKPGLAKKYAVREYNTYIVETAGGHKEVLSKLTEESLTNGILKAMAGSVKKIYFMQGHGERDIEDKEAPGWLTAKQSLESAGYSINKVNLYTSGEIPKDASLLIIAGPSSDFQPAEVERLKRRLDEGKPIIFFIDPVKLPNLQGLLTEYGFEVFEDLTLDPISQQLGFDPMVSAVAEYHGHPAVADLRGASFFPIARSIELNQQNKKKAEVKPIASTSKSSWSEFDMASIEKGAPTFDDKTDRPGPRILIASAEWEGGAAKHDRKIGEKPVRARLIVAGDSDFAANATLGMSANRDLFLNMTSWLLEEENRISIRPKPKGFQPILFTGPQLAAIFWVAVVLAPLSVISIGIYVWRRRRT
jgi:ABC-type uncharacterized transport system involved in gliding motility auxiliary subunit